MYAAGGFVVAGRVVVRADDHGRRSAGSLWDGTKHMRKQWLARHRMQDLWQGGAHARPLAGREHNRKAGSAGHPYP